MRLLQCKPNSKSGDVDLVFTQDLITDIPPYAVLSHTWGADDEEVTYQDIKDNINDERVLNKPGYQKILFCSRQAQNDGLEHFWVDTCCIDKTNNTELHEAINSMFTWYQNSAACYVYLSDVLRNDQERTGKRTRSTWKLAFRQSRWHTRGWTLQELVASSSLEFYSSDFQRLGDKQSLAQLINEASHVPLSILRGNSLSKFSTEERISWSEHRTTKRPEDKAYSLLGIVGVYMPLIYGEGEVRALERLRREIQFAQLETDDRTNRCLKDLRISDPRDDKSRIESAKGGLLKDCYQWILNQEDYLKWLHDDERPLLWVKGDPGKGKTMLLCGIINELSSISENQPSISYFFCQAADVKLNHAAAVLRGLIYMLVRQNPDLMKYLLEEWKVAGAGLFQDFNAWDALTRIMRSMLQHITSSEIVVFIVDALDECARDLPKLLSFIVQQSASGKAKWLVSSRNWPEIEEQLDYAMSKIRLSLEINAHAISAAVTVYIHQRVREIGSIKRMSEAQKREMAQYFIANADNTFLWVALICQRLRDPKVRKRHVMSELKQFPSGVDEMYERMMQLMDDSRDASTCREILATMASTYRPLNLHELSLLLSADVFDDDATELADIIQCCGSFLLVRQNVVYFVHQSAKDFLVKLKETPLFVNGIHSKHASLCITSLKAFSRQLRQDIYGLRKPGIAVTELRRPSSDPLDSLRYSCIFWIDHFLAATCDGSQGRTEVAIELLRDFFTKDYLHWLEALSLSGAVPVGHAAVAALYRFIKSSPKANVLEELVYDALRFFKFNALLIAEHPLQIYISALVFSPMESLVRRHFGSGQAMWLSPKPEVERRWGVLLQTFEGHSSIVSEVTFSHSGKLVASASGDGTVRIWDVATGNTLQRLLGHESFVYSVAFSPNDKRLTSGSADETVRIWDVATGQMEQVIEGHEDTITCVRYSMDGRLIASASTDSTVRIWDAHIGMSLLTINTPDYDVIAFSPDSRLLASISRTLRFWDTATGRALKTLTPISPFTHYHPAIAFSPDGKLLAYGVGTWDKRPSSIELLDVETGSVLRTVSDSLRNIECLAFSPCGSFVASGSKEVRVWDARAGGLLQTLIGHTRGVSSVSFCPDDTLIASASYDHSVRLWDTAIQDVGQAVGRHTGRFIERVISPNNTLFADVLGDNTINIWDVVMGRITHVLEGHEKFISSIVFSPNSKLLASVSFGGTVKVWDTMTGKSEHTLVLGTDVCCVNFSPDTILIASGSDNGGLHVWEATSGKVQHILRGHTAAVKSITFSPDGKFIASYANDQASDDNQVFIWQVETAQFIPVMHGLKFDEVSVAFSPDCSLVAMGGQPGPPLLFASETGQLARRLESCYTYPYADSLFSGWCKFVFSPDCRLVAANADTLNRREIVHIWNVNTGKLRCTIELSHKLTTISFDTTGTKVFTNLGVFDFGTAEEIPALPTRISDFQPPGTLLKGAYSIGLGLSGSWITFDGANILWLPIEYRCRWQAAAILGDTVIIACGAAEVLFFRFDRSQLQYLGTA